MGAKNNDMLVGPCTWFHKYRKYMYLQKKQQPPFQESSINLVIYTTIVSYNIKCSTNSMKTGGPNCYTVNMPANS